MFSLFSYLYLCLLLQALIICGNHFFKAISYMLFEIKK